MQTASPTGPRARILEVISASPTPLTVQEIVAQTNISANGIYMEVYRLRKEGRLKRRKRPHKGRARASEEYFVTLPEDEPKRLEDYPGEIPDHVWWDYQEANGFKRPRRAPKHVDVERV